MRNLHKLVCRFAALSCIALAGCTQHLEAPEFSSGWDSEVLTVAFTSDSDVEYFGPGETRQIGIQVTGAVTTQVEAPGGWTAEYVNSVLSVTAPERDAEGFAALGNVVVTAVNRGGESRSASLKVCYSEALTFAFSSHEKLLIEMGESRNVSFISTGAERFAVEVPKGWKAEVAGTELKVSAPDYLALDYAASGKVVVQASANGETVEDSIDVEVGVTGKDLNADGRTANCYIVSEGGRYKFNALVMGNGESGLSDGLKAKLADHGYNLASTVLPKASQAFLLWETTQGSITNVRLSADRSSVNFMAASSSAVRQGNAVIAVADASGKVMWSWHIWMTDVPKEQTYKSGHVMMDRNLGAWSSEPAKLGSMGLFYQWGRKDPFPGGCAVNSGNGQEFQAFVTDRTLPTFNAEGYTFQVMPTDLTVGTIDYVVSHPWIYVYTVLLGSGDWYQGITGMYASDRNEYLWGNPQGYELVGGVFRKGQKSIYDPCPPGYRVPDADAFVCFSTNGSLGGTSKHNIHGTVDDYRMPTDIAGLATAYWIIGLNFIYDAAGNYTWFPAAGDRISETGRTQSVGMNIFQWTSAPYNASQPGQAFYLWASKQYMYPMRDGGDHAYGYSVRCQKE